MKGVVEEFSYCDHGTSWIVSAFVIGDCNDNAKAQCKEHLCSCVDAASGAGDKPPVFTFVDRGSNNRYVIPTKSADESYDNPVKKLSKRSFELYSNSPTTCFP